MYLSLLLWIFSLLGYGAATSFATGEEAVPARCQMYNPKHRYRNLTMNAISLDVELLKMAEGNQPAALTRLGCPKGYQLFSELHCIPVDTLHQLSAGAIGWDQVLDQRVNKSSLKHLNRDTGRCANHGPSGAPSEEFDDQFCLSLQAICSYKFGYSEFDWVVSRIERYPLPPGQVAQSPGRAAHVKTQLSGRKCGDKRLSFQYAELIEFDETHCVRKSAMESYLRAQASWHQVMAAKKAKRLLEAASSASSDVAASAKAKSSGGTVLQVVVPLIRSYGVS